MCPNNEICLSLQKNKFGVYMKNKKVLLCERKRHTDCRLSSTPSVNQSGVPPIRVSPLGYPHVGVPPHRAYPPQGTPLAGPGSGTPPPAEPGSGTPPHWTWLGYPPSSRCGQTENITFPHPSDAVGNNFILSLYKMSMLYISFLLTF